MRGCYAFVPAVAICLSGCGDRVHGRAAPYRSDAGTSVHLTLPGNAPYISQQFFVAANGAGRSHNGIDIVGHRGRAVLAAASGRVIVSVYGPAYGHRVTIDHGADESGQRIETQYVHLQTRLVEAGQDVARGEEIGTMGSTGMLAAMLVHLHFEVHVGRRGPAADARDPNLFWMDGVGRFTCFEPGRAYRDRPFRITSPTTCG